MPALSESQPHAGECVFCRIVAGGVEAAVVRRGAHSVVFMDARPVFKGHALVIPLDHLRTLADVPDTQLGPFMADVRAVSAAVPVAFGAQGSFVAMNNIVSQSVPHLHVHVVPRTKGDGLRGFFWPRTRYQDPLEAAGYAERLAVALTDADAAPGAVDSRA